MPKLSPHRAVDEIVEAGERREQAERHHGAGQRVAEARGAEEAAAEPAVLDPRGIGDDDAEDDDDDRGERRDADRVDRLAEQARREAGEVEPDPGLVDQMERREDEADHHRHERRAQAPPQPRTPRSGRRAGGAVRCGGGAEALAAPGRSARSTTRSTTTASMTSASCAAPARFDWLIQVE